jgi:hypothetical protein
MTKYPCHPHLGQLRLAHCNYRTREFFSLCTNSCLRLTNKLAATLTHPPHASDFRPIPRRHRNLPWSDLSPAGVLAGAAGREPACRFRSGRSGSSPSRGRRGWERSGCDGARRRGWRRGGSCAASKEATHTPNRPSVAMGHRANSQMLEAVDLGAGDRRANRSSPGNDRPQGPRRSDARNGSSGVEGCEELDAVRRSASMGCMRSLMRPSPV